MVNEFEAVLKWLFFGCITTPFLSAHYNPVRNPSVPQNMWWVSVSSKSSVMVPRF